MRQIQAEAWATCTPPLLGALLPKWNSQVRLLSGIVRAQMPGAMLLLGLCCSWGNITTFSSCDSQAMVCLIRITPPVATTWVSTGAAMSALKFGFGKLMLKAAGLVSFTRDLGMVNGGS